MSCYSSGLGGAHALRMLRSDLTHEVQSEIVVMKLKSLILMAAKPTRGTVELSQMMDLCSFTTRLLGLAWRAARVSGAAGCSPNDYGCIEAKGGRCVLLDRVRSLGRS